MKREFHWIICERTGRWAAALRVLLARERKADQSAIAGDRGVRMRIHELRNLETLTTALEGNRPSLGLVEVQAENLQAVLERFAADLRRNVRHIALVDADSGPQSVATRQAIADAVLEVGALAALDSPRQMRTALEIGKRIAASRPSADNELAFALPWRED